MEKIVLLVDDEPHVLQALERGLRHEPFTFLTATSAEQAQAVFQVCVVDALVADERMPRMSGSELAAWCALQHPETQRLILTGQPDAESAMRAINSGAVFRYLAKPTSAAHLAAAIHAAIEAREQSRALIEATQRLMYEADMRRIAVEEKLERLQMLIGADARRGG